MTSSSTTLLTGAVVYDGSGSAGAPADVLIAGDRIAEVAPAGSIDPTTADQRRDLRGFALAPGFIDIHTHYDAQITWDRDLIPSSWHGITTVVLGNCGYSIAPTKPSDRHVIVKTLEAVEGMSAESLETGIVWEFESFAEYLEQLDSGVRLNVAGLVGHTALRVYVMGNDAMEREATPDEIASMEAILRSAIQSGALGFSTSRASVDNGAYGKPVPSRMASRDELYALCKATGEAGGRVIQIIPGQEPLEMMVEMARVSGLPVTFGAIVTGLFGGPGAAVARAQLCAEAGNGTVVPQISCRPIVQQLTMRDPFSLTILSPAFLEALQVAPAERAHVYSQPEWFERAAASLSERWSARLRDAEVVDSATAELCGRTLGEIGAERGTDPLRTFVDLSLAEDLATRVNLTLFNDDQDELGELLRDPTCLLGLSDAGAHQSQICDAVYSSHLLSHWVRDRKALSLESAIWRLTGHPAEVFGIEGRGYVKAGYAADLVAFDPALVGAGPLERVHDLPAGADRLISRSRGVDTVWVNGTMIREGGVDLEQRPGTVIRSQ